MTEIRHEVVTNHGTGEKTVFAFFPNEDESLVSATSNHPHFTSIVRGLEAGDETIYGLFNITVGINRKFERLSARYSIRGDKFYRDLDPLDNALADQIIRFMDAGVDDWQPLVKFLERVDANPNPESREALYSWISKDVLTLTDEGMIVGYKSVKPAGSGMGNYTSTRSGYAVVDGKEINGYVPNKPGSIIEMPRSMVDDNRNNHCSTGLHIGTWGYASTFNGGKFILEVEFDPADAVAVPRDDAGKLRVCRYKVVGLKNAAYNGPLRGMEDYHRPEDVPDDPDRPDTF